MESDDYSNDQTVTNDTEPVVMKRSDPGRLLSQSEIDALIAELTSGKS